MAQEAGPHVLAEQHLWQHLRWMPPRPISKFSLTDHSIPSTRITPPKDLNLVLLVSSIFSTCPILTKELELP